MKNKLYVGLAAGGAREVFRSPAEPTEESHGDRFAAVIGPFRTFRGARFMADPVSGRNNPHCRCVADAERISAKYAR